MSKTADAVPGSIQLRCVDDTHFAVAFDRPGRIEVSVHMDGNRPILIAHVYDGAVVDMDQEPLGAFDSTVESQDWTSSQPGRVDGEE